MPLSAVGADHLAATCTNVGVKHHHVTFHDVSSAHNLFSFSYFRFSKAIYQLKAVFSVKNVGKVDYINDVSTMFKEIHGRPAL